MIVLYPHQVRSYQANDLIRLAGGKGNIPHRPHFPFEGDHNPGIFQEVERGAVPFPDEHEVDACTSHAHGGRYLVEAAVFNIVQRNPPCDDAEFEGQRFGGQADGQRSVIEHIEQEEHEKEEENSRKEI